MATSVHEQRKLPWKANVLMYYTYAYLLRLTAASSFDLITDRPTTPPLAGRAVIALMCSSNCARGIYRGGNKGLCVLLSKTQAGPGRTVKQEQEEISRNHVQTIISPSVIL